jgi:hypothetical protein
MNPAPASTNLNSCGCGASGVESPTLITNRPGLSAIAYRAGTLARFKRSMLARLSASDLSALRGLLTREDDDFSIALLDGWALLADVLTFYQERIANESYLRTATERLSLIELARLIGYRPSPGVAASAYLAFTLDASPGSPTSVAIDIGAQTQSLPGPGEAPQVFETVEAIEARPTWNAIKARSTLVPSLDTPLSELWLAGVASGLAPGDALLTASATDPSAGANQAATFYRVVAVNPDPANQRTQVIVDIEYSNSGSAMDSGAAPALPWPPLDPQSLGSAYSTPIPLNSDAARTLLEGQIWRGSDLEALAAAQGWSIGDIFNSIIARRGADPDDAEGALSLFAFRARAPLFGYNAPNWPMLPSSVHTAYAGSGTDNNTEWIYPTKATATASLNANQLNLSAVYNKIAANKTAANSWVVVRRVDTDFLLDWSEWLTVHLLGWNYPPPPPPTIIATVTSATEVGLADFTISARVTSLQLAPLDSTVDAKPQDMDDIRNITVYAQSEKLLRTGARITDALSGANIDLDGYYDGLRAGQAIAVTGQRADLPGVVASEIRFISDIIHDTGAGGVTWLMLTKALAYQYHRETVTINANVALATHGQAQAETLGNGDASQPYQRFTLRQAPLTYTSAASGGGVESSLAVRVNDVLWHEVATLYDAQSRDRVFVTQPQDDGTTAVEFGDGQTGARPPSGQNNITATYRRGVGLAGLVKARQLSLLMSHPMGVTGVVNPLAATGGADPETLESARVRAPLSTLTLGRIVSLSDYQAFAQAFAGIGKALATWTWDGQTRGVFVTVAGAGGADLPSDSPIFDDLVKAMRKASEPYVDLRVQSYRKAYFRLSADVLTDPNLRPERVLAAVEAALRAAFSFEARAFGQPVSLSEVISVIQDTPGALAVTVSQFYRSDKSLSREDTLSAAAPGPGSAMSVDAAELLTLDPAPLTGLEVMS